MGRAEFDRLLTLAFTLSRLGIFVLIFFVLHLAPRGDILMYAGEASSARAGLLPYGGFLSSYAPLHPYLDAGLMQLWHSPLSFVLLAICAECVMLPLWLEVGRAFVEEEHLRTAALLYAASAVSVQFVTIDGQNNIFVSLLLVFSLLMLWRLRDARSGVAAGFAVAGVKFLPLLYVPVFVLAARRRPRWATGFALPVAVVYGVCLLLRLPILQPLLREGDMRSPGDLPFLVEAAVGVAIPGGISNLVLLAAVGAILVHTLRLWQRTGREQGLEVVTFGMAALTLALLLFAKKSWPAYLILAWFPICLCLGKRAWGSILLFGGFNLIAVVEHSYWASVLGQYSSLDAHRLLLQRSSQTVVFLVLQCVLLAFYTWLLLLALRAMRLHATRVEGSLISHAASSG